MKGTAEERAALSFALFDADGSGAMDTGEVGEHTPSARVHAVVGRTV